MDRLEVPLSKSVKIYKKFNTMKNMDCLFSSICLLILGIVSLIANLYMQYLVFTTKFGMASVVILLLLVFLLPLLLYGYISKNREDTIQRHIILSIVKLICSVFYCYIYYIVLKTFVYSDILLYFLVGITIISYILYIFKFENMSILVDSIKTTGVGLCLSYALFNIVEIKTFILIVAMTYIPVYISSSVNVSEK